MKYNVILNYEATIDVDDDENIVDKFFAEHVYDTQQDEATFIEDNLRIKRIGKGKK
jgi:hypothetical protein